MKSHRLLVSVILLASACNTDPTISTGMPGGGSSGGGASGSGTGGTSGKPPVPPPSGGATGATGGAGGSMTPITGFTPGQIGGYKLGDPVTGDMPGDAKCDALLAVVRDFKGANEPGGHPDFESFA